MDILIVIIREGGDGEMVVSGREVARGSGSTGGKWRERAIA
jgi:hypothetical protein